VLGFGMAENRLPHLAATRLLFIVLTFLSSACLLPAQDRGTNAARVYKGNIKPYWLTNKPGLWYRNRLRDGASEFVLVDAEHGTRVAAFDQEKLAAALSRAAGQQIKPDRLPFNEFDFVENGAGISFLYGTNTWRCSLSNYDCASVSPLQNAPDSPSGNQSDNRSGRAQRRQRAGSGSEIRSIDGKWAAFVREHNVFVRDESSGNDIQLSRDGEATNSYSLLEWSPDSRTLLAWRVEAGDIGSVYLVESSPPGGGRAVLQVETSKVLGSYRGNLSPAWA